MDFRLGYAHAVSSKAIHFIDPTTLVFRGGNTLVFLNIARRAHSVLHFGRDVVLDAFHVCPTQRRVYVALRGRKTYLRGYQFPGKELVQEVEHRNVLPIRQLAVSRCATRLATISFHAEPKLLLWALHPVDTNKDKVQEGYHAPANTHTLAGGTPLVGARLEPQTQPFTCFSFNPANRNEFVTGSTRGVTIWRFRRGAAAEPLLVRAHAFADTRRAPRAGKDPRTKRDSLARAVTSELLQAVVDPDNINLAAAAGYMQQQQGSKHLSGASAAVADAAAAAAVDSSSAAAAVGLRQDQDGDFVLSVSRAGGRPPSAARAADADGNMRDQTRTILCHTWNSDGALLCGTQYSEILIFRRGPRNDDDDDDDDVVDRLHVEVEMTELRSSVLSLALSSTHLLVGLQGGRIVWLSRDGFLPVSSRHMSDHPIIHVEHSPDYRKFLVIDRVGALFIASASAAADDDGGSADGADGALRVHHFALNQVLFTHDRVDTLPPLLVGALCRDNVDIAETGGADGNVALAALQPPQSDIATVLQRGLEDADAAKPAERPPHLVRYPRLVAKYGFNANVQERICAFVKEHQAAATVDQPASSPRGAADARAASSDFLTMLQTPSAASTEVWTHIGQKAMAEDLFSGLSLPLPIFAHQSGDSLFVARATGECVLASGEDRAVAASRDLGEIVTCTTQSPRDDALVVIGFESGVLRIVDRKHRLLRVLFAHRVHDGPVAALRSSPDGAYWASLGADCSLMFIRCRDMKLGGWTTVPADTVCIDWLHIAGALYLFVGRELGDALLLRVPSPTDDLLAQEWSLEEDLGARRGKLDVAALAVTNDPFSERGFYAVTADKKLKHYELEANGNGSSAATFVRLEEVYGHSKPARCIAVSPNGLFVATGGSGGQVIVRATKDLLSSSSILAHDASSGGVASLQFSPDSESLLSTGADGGVFQWSVRLTPPRRRAGAAAAEVATDTRTLVTIPSAPTMEASERQSLPTMDAAVTASAMSFRLSQLRDLRLRLHPAASAKSESEAIEVAVTDLRSRLRALIRRNETVGKEQRVDRDECFIDTDYLDTLSQNAAQEEARTRMRVAEANACTELVADRVKRLCWDGTSTPFGVVRGIKEPDTHVANFAIRKPSREADLRLKRILLLRRVGVLQGRWLLEHTSDDANTGGLHVDSRDIGARKASYISFYNAGVTDTQPEDDIAALTAAVAGPSAAAAVTASSLGAAPRSSASRTGKGSNGIVGKNAPANGFTLSVAVHMLFHPMECVTHCRQVTQMALLCEHVSALKRDFNERFDALALRKRECADLIADRTKRITEIELELKMEPSASKVQFADDEDPETVLTVRHGDTAVSPWMSAEERVKADAACQLTAEQRSQADAEARAINSMMGGKLKLTQTLTDLDALPSRPAWMDSVESSAMTDEQRMAVVDFERAHKAAVAEHENRLRLLESELKKLKSDTMEASRQFDAAVAELFALRLEVQRKILLDEYMVLVLASSLEANAQSTFVERLFAVCLEDYKVRKGRHAVAANNFQELVQEQQKVVHAAMAEDRDADRGFRARFSDAGDSVDALYTMFKSRKVANRRGGKDEDHTKKVPVGFEDDPFSTEDGVEDEEVTVTAMPNGSDEDFEWFDPASVRTPTYAPLQLRDMPMSAAANISTDLWRRLTAYRDAKLALERKLAVESAKLAAMQQHAADLEQQGDFLQSNLRQLMHRKLIFEERRANANLDADVVLNVEQGLVEIEEAPVVNDMTDCLLVRRQDVEDLNAVIVGIASETIGVLRNMMRFRSGIKALRWERRRLQLTLEDAESVTKELQLLRVTKNLQALVKAGGRGNGAAAQAAALERSMGQLRRMTRSQLNVKRNKLAALQRKLRGVDHDNARLAQSTKKLTVLVRERMNIASVRNDEGIRALQERERTQRIAERRRLRTISAQQKEDLRRLRAERDALRARSFPSFAPKGKAGVPRLPPVDRRRGAR